MLDCQYLFQMADFTLDILDIESKMALQEEEEEDNFIAI